MVSGCQFPWKSLDLTVVGWAGVGSKNKQGRLYIRPKLTLLVRCHINTEYSEGRPRICLLRLSVCLSETNIWSFETKICRKAKFVLYSWKFLNNFSWVLNYAGASASKFSTITMAQYPLPQDFEKKSSRDGIGISEKIQILRIQSY